MKMGRFLGWPNGLRQITPRWTPMAAHSIHILIVEDNMESFRLLERTIGRVQRVKIYYDHAKSLADFFHLFCNRDYDAILLDLYLPDSTPRRTMTEVLKCCTSEPVIVLTTLNDEEMGELALQEGAQDYIPKQELRPDGLGRSILYAIKRKQAENELRRVNSVLEQSNSELSDFADLVKKELTPIIKQVRQQCTMIDGFLDSKADQSLRDCIQMSISSTQQISHTLDILQNYAAIGIPNTPVPIQTQPLLEDVVRQLKTDPSLRNLAITTPKQFPEVIAVEQDMRRLLENLIRFFASTSLENPRVVLKATRRRYGFATFEVSGAWDGKEKKGQGKILIDIFRKLNNYDRSLLLLICQKLVERQKGSIWVETRPNHSTSVFFEIPDRVTLPPTTVTRSIYEM